MRITKSISPSISFLVLLLISLPKKYFCNTLFKTFFRWLYVTEDDIKGLPCFQVLKLPSSGC